MTALSPATALVPGSVLLTALVPGPVLFSAAALLAGLGAAAGCRWLLPLLADLARRGGACRPNFRGESLPVGLGAAAALPVLGVVAVGAAFHGFPARIALGLSFPGLVMILAGWMDDQWGDGSVRGLRGHWRAARRGVWTTGGFKALAGLSSALVGGLLLSGGSPGAGILGAGLLAGAANGINLLDVRPGRAWKVLVLLWGLLLAVRLLSADRDSAWDPGLFLAVASVGALLVYGPWDLGERVMMGDAGANGLGVLLGAGIILCLPLIWQGVAFAGVVLLHYGAEKGSVSAWIEGIPLLRRADGWGRKKTQRT